MQLTKETSLNAERYSRGNKRPFANREAVLSPFIDRDRMKVLPQFITPGIVRHFLKILRIQLSTFALYSRLFPSFTVLANFLQPFNYFQISFKWANSGKPPLIILSEFSLRIALVFNFPQTLQIWIFATAKFSVTVSRPSIL